MQFLLMYIIMLAMCIKIILSETDFHYLLDWPVQKNYIWTKEKRGWIRYSSVFVCVLSLYYTITHIARGSENTSAWMCIIRSPPAAYSITKHTCSLVWKQAKRLTRNGCRTLFTVSKILFSHIRLGDKMHQCQGKLAHMSHLIRLSNM